MTPEQREDLQWLAVLDTLDPKAVGLRHAESIRAALAEIDSLKARIDKLLLAGLQAEAKLATTLQDRVECVECHALIPSGGEWPSSPHPESSSLCWGCGPGTHRIKELEAELDETHEGWATEALSLQARLAAAEEFRTKHETCCLEETYRLERDQARRDLDRKDHECASLKADLEQSESRLAAFVAAVRDADAHATPYGEDAFAYIVSAGAWHRLLGVNCGTSLTGARAAEGKP